MHAVVVRRHGGPEALELEDVAEPVPGEGELLIEVDVAGVTLPVVRQLRGGVALPFRPGGEVAGRVLAVGAGVTGWAAGDRLAGIAFQGALAARAVVPAAFQVPVPERVAAADALALVRSGQVALGTLRAAAVVPGETVLVTAAAGGVGHLAVQLAAVVGAGRVIAAVGDEAKASFLSGLGVDDVVTYPRLAEGAVKDVDVVLDGVGGDVQALCLPLLAPFGRLVAFNGVGGPVDTNELRMHGRSVIGFAMPHLATRRRAAYEEQQRELWQWHGEGRLRPMTHGPFPLERVAEAFDAIDSRANRGKVMVAP